MDKDTLEKMANQAFKNVNVTRAALFAAAEKAIYFSMNLDADKASLLQSGKIDGKNAEIREAQIRELLADKYTELAIAQNAERRARFDFDQAGYEVDTVKTLLRIAELPA